MRAMIVQDNAVLEIKQGNTVIKTRKLQFVRPAEMISITLLKEELGNAWLMPDMFRIGASSLLTDLERQLYHNITGHYAARHHMPMA